MLVSLTLPTRFLGYRFLGGDEEEWKKEVWMYVGRVQLQMV